MQTDISKHHLETTWDKSLKKGQAINIYDATALNDSISYVNPPSTRYYEWKSIPDNGCLSFFGSYKYGHANITFNCSGDFQIFANVYDSASQAEIGTTDTMLVKVSNDTLYPAQAIRSDDILWLKPGITQIRYVDDPTKPVDLSEPADEVRLSVGFTTTGEYEYNSVYNKIPVTSTVGTNSYSVVLSDSIYLTSYPFSNGNGSFSRYDAGVDLKDIAAGLPATLSITWLGKTYTGKITLVNDSEYSLEWDSSGAVKVEQGY